MALEPPPDTWSLQDHSRNLRRVLCSYPKFRKLSDKNSLESFPWSWLKDFFSGYRNQHKDRVALMRLMRAGLLDVIYGVFMDHQFQYPTSEDLECLRELSLSDLMSMVREMLFPVQVKTDRFDQGTMWAHASSFCMSITRCARIVLGMKESLRSGLDGLLELSLESSWPMINALNHHPILAHIEPIISSCPDIALVFVNVIQDTLQACDGVWSPNRCVYCTSCGRLSLPQPCWPDALASL